MDSFLPNTSQTFSTRDMLEDFGWQVSRLTSTSSTRSTVTLVMRDSAYVLVKNSVLQDVKIWKKKGRYTIHDVLPWINSSDDPLKYPIVPDTIILAVRCTCRSTKNCGCCRSPYPYPTIAHAQTKSGFVSKDDLMPVFVTA